MQRIKDDVAHDDDGDQNQGDQHVEDADTTTLLTSVVRDPHVQELLLNKTTTDPRAADRRKSKLAQLEIDSNTPLYDPGRGPEESRLRVALDILQMKAKHKWTDVSFDDNMEFQHDLLPKGNKCPTSIEEAKKIVCPLDVPHDK